MDKSRRSGTAMNSDKAGKLWNRKAAGQEKTRFRNTDVQNEIPLTIFITAFIVTLLCQKSKTAA